MKLPNLKHTTEYCPTEIIEYIFGFPRCNLTCHNREKTGLCTTNGNIIIPDKLYIKAGSDILTHDEIIEELNRHIPSYPKYTHYPILECEIKPPGVYLNAPMPIRYNEVEYMTAILEYCFVNDIHIPNQTHVLKFCLENNNKCNIDDVKRKFKLSDDHLQILNVSLSGNHRL